MIHADYAYYTDVYFSDAIPEKEFTSFALRAAAQLEQYKRVYTVNSSGEDSEKKAICAMADAMYCITLAQNGVGAVSSASIGSVSVSYANPQGLDLSAKGQAREIYEAACLFLDIYRG
jgi:hypothetical protein